MNTSKKILYKLIEEIPENQITEVIDFLSYLKVKKDRAVFKELENASESSLVFWNNEIDDEVWNDV